MFKKGCITLIGLLVVFSVIGCSDGQTKNEQDPAPQEQTQVTVLPSDYTMKDNWLSIPEQVIHEADVIYFYPTCYSPTSEDGPTVCEIDNEGMREAAQTKLIDQASVFEMSADIYAPYYRQVDAMTLAGMTQEEMIEAESGEPKADVFAALDYYFEHYNEGRPFFLAGHSQGSMMIYLTLDEYMEEHPEVYDRMIAAYMIGNAATQDWLDENPHVKMAQNSEDTGVVVSWNTEGPANIGHYNMVVPEGAVCINPLNWKTDATPAGVEENKGSLVQDETGAYIVVGGLADATIDLERGSVICSSVDPATYAIPPAMESLFGPESYHGWDYKFYYKNIQENIAERLGTYLNV